MNLINYVDKLGNEKHVTISIGFDGKKIPPALMLSTMYGNILGGTEPIFLSL